MQSIGIALNTDLDQSCDDLYLDTLQCQTYDTSDTYDTYYMCCIHVKNLHNERLRWRNAVHALFITYVHRRLVIYPLKHVPPCVSM